ncbi:acetyl-CoA C-acyltransferase, partial [Campylobacter jejuni]
DAAYGTETMPRTGENVAAEYRVSRADQDGFALRSQQRAAAAQASGYFAEEIVAVAVPAPKGASILVDR